jgi:type IV secretory pathway TrbL component
VNNKAFKVLVGVFLAESLAVICLSIAGLIMAIWDELFAAIMIMVMLIGVLGLFVSIAGYMMGREIEKMRHKASYKQSG